jgi:hypothetical protein
MRVYGEIALGTCGVCVNASAVHYQPMTSQLCISYVACKYQLAGWEGQNKCGIVLEQVCNEKWKSAEQAEKCKKQQSAECSGKWCIDAPFVYDIRGVCGE